jgi:lysozyme family protein
MASFADYRDEYKRIWNSLVIRPVKLPDARRNAEELLAWKAIYQIIETRTVVP